MKNAIITIIVIILLIVGITYAITGFDGSEDSSNNTNVPTSTNERTEEREDIRTITAKHEFADGTHTVAGEIDMPTPCDLLEVEAEVVNPRSAVLHFTTVNESEGACAQVITPQRFKTSFEADENADITATFGGDRARLNLIDVPEGETLDDFEVFIKG